MDDRDPIGRRYQQATRYSRRGDFSGERPLRRPDPFKTIPGAPAIELPAVQLPEGSLWSALENRRSRRTFTSEPITTETLSRLCWALAGATARAGAILLRTAPSAGALYPYETYVAVNRVEGIGAGIYHYRVPDHAIERVSDGLPGPALAAAALGQNLCEHAAAVFIITAVPDRGRWKYAERAWRYIYLDAGHMMQNLYLSAEDLGLGCCGIGAFFDEEVDALLRIDGEAETAIYLAAVGPVRGGSEL